MNESAIRAQIERIMLLEKIAQVEASDPDELEQRVAAALMEHEDTLSNLNADSVFRLFIDDLKDNRGGYKDFKQPLGDGQKLDLEDLFYWTSQPFWTAHEGTSILADLHPDWVSMMQFREPAISDLCKDRLATYRDVHRIVLKSIELDELGERPSPREFLEWANPRFRFRKQLWPLLRLQELLLEARNRANQPDPQAAKSESDAAETHQPVAPHGDEINPKEKSSLLKLVFGMAVASYGFDPRGERNRAISEIHRDLADLEIELDHKTIRKWLNEGASKTFSADWPEKAKKVRARRRRNLRDSLK